MMKQRGILCLGIFFIVIAIFSLVTAHAGSIPAIKVGLVWGEREISLPLTESGRIYDFSRKAPLTLLPAGDRLFCTAVEGTIFINDLPVSPGPLLLFSDSTSLSWNDRSYRGAFLITASGETLTLINWLLLEEYLRGVVPKEMFPSWPLAALKAQAITARTYTLKTLQKHRDQGFDLCAGVHCQAYGGVFAECPTTDQAVCETMGQVLTFRGKLASTFYHSASGGMTSAPSRVWTSSSSIPYLEPVTDWDQNSPHTQWTRSFSWPELEAVVLKTYPKIGRLKQVLPAKLEPDGKVVELHLIGIGVETKLTGEQFRNLLGLPSGKFRLGMIYGPEPTITLWWNRDSLFPEALMANTEIPGLTADLLQPPWDQPDPWAWLQDKEPVRIVLQGSGWGHGVGMSQWGAKGMADAGFDTVRILRHYFPGTEISLVDLLNFF